ncbi:PIN domain-containing protein [Solemya elarraichensis gill symbiont]|uniref:DUF4935 domain-containing protein n=1 Tax=Solemya elarraichensis gill symbiont TaxID=1918949 RepID=A0A1T2KYR8_9GAMM|nr:PIN domain-containing protein [Solemya elarraichensis gill symbiont]OOZ37982.1 hypothetical protein BOW52_09710 [Solemya elarraichensis gill symbiont]
MAKINRRKPPAHILILDTNVLFSENKELCASSEFHDFWNEYSSKYDIELILPEVVKGELLYQHTSSALTTLERINSQFDNLSAYTDKTYKHRVKAQHIRKDMESRFDKWISSLNAEVVETPCKSIDWERLTNDAIWRNPPFTEEKDKKHEKGFRDSLIMETVVQFIEDKPNANIVFISNDTALSGESKRRVGANKFVSFYETLDEFASFLRLLDEQFTNEFIQAIQARARLKFYNKKDDNCLYVKERVINRIRTDYSHIFSTPPTKRSLGLAISTPLTPTKGKWTIASDEGIWVFAPNYIEHSDEKRFTWGSRIEFVRLYRYSGLGIGSLLTAYSGQENLRKLEFKVVWTATVGKDASFRNLKLVSIELEDEKFELATEDDKKRYAIESSIE